MVAAGWTWTNSNDVTITNAVTEDGRLLNGQTASTRCRMMMEGYVKEDGSRGAWVLLGYEETKGLGPGHPDETGDGQDEVTVEPPDMGKIVKADTFAFDTPSLRQAGPHDQRARPDQPGLRRSGPVHGPHRERQG